MTEAVLFDFDGVIAQTLPHHTRSWRHVLGPLGAKVEERDVAVNEGQPAIEIAKALLKKNGLNLPEEEVQRLMAAKRAHYRKTTAAKPYPGVEQVLDVLKQQGLKLGLVTGSVWDNLVAAVGEELLGKFDVVITSEHVKKGKPSPDPYLEAARRLGVEPRACVVVENAPLGIRSAKAAGMRCIAVTSTLPPEVLSEADCLIEKIAELTPEHPCLTT
ncbi:MAG: HAD-IA family hydrolase [Calditrichaeota bacterium]|nr:HAD-IA family hydrolase [Calditrichota bacterium]